MGLIHDGGVRLAAAGKIGCTAETLRRRVCQVDHRAPTGRGDLRDTIPEGMKLKFAAVKSRSSSQHLCRDDSGSRVFVDGISHC